LGLLTVPQIHQTAHPDATPMRPDPDAMGAPVMLGFPGVGGVSPEL